MTTLETPRAPRRGRPLIQLAGLAPRLLSWTPLAVAAATIFGVLVWRFDTLDNPSEAVVVMRIVAFVTAMGMAFMLDDASRNVTAPSVVTQRWRIGLRICVVIIVSASLEALAAVVVSTQAENLGFLPGVALEAVCLLALGTALALVLQNHFGMPEPGNVVAVALVISAMLMLMLSARWPMFAMPDAAWVASHQRWAVIGLVAVAVVIYELRDPASRSFNVARRGLTARR